MTRLQQEAAAARELIEQLRIIDLADDEQLVEDTIEGQTELKEIVSWALRKIAEAEALEAGAKAARDQAAARAARFEARAARFREAITEALGIVGLKRLELPEATLSVSTRAPSVIVTDATLVPAAYQRTKTVTEPDKAAIKAALEAGTYVEGATLSNPRPSLTIRRT